MDKTQINEKLLSFLFHIVRSLFFCCEHEAGDGARTKLCGEDSFNKNKCDLELAKSN